MSKRYQVLREMPFCKVGDILNEDDDLFISFKKGNLLTYLIQEGWIKPVEEERELILSAKKPTEHKNIYDEIYTEEIDEKELSKIKARARIRRFIGENKLREGNISPIYDKEEKIFETYTYYPHFVNEYGFSNFEDCEKLISSCSDELKIVFGIE